MSRVHGQFLAADVGELAGVSGTAIGQWARRGLIRASVSAGDPHVYSLEDLAEAVIVGELLRRGVSHADIRHAIGRLAQEYGTWPLSDAPLGTTAADGRTRVVLRERDGFFALSARGWQRTAAPPVVVEEVRLRFSRGR